METADPEDLLSLVSKREGTANGGIARLRDALEQRIALPFVPDDHRDRFGVFAQCKEPLNREGARRLAEQALPLFRAFLQDVRESTYDRLEAALFLNWLGKSDGQDLAASIVSSYNPRDLAAVNSSEDETIQEAAAVDDAAVELLARANPSRDLLALLPKNATTSLRDGTMKLVESVRSDSQLADTDVGVWWTRAPWLRRPQAESGSPRSEAQDK